MIRNHDRSDEVTATGRTSLSVTRFGVRFEVRAPGALLPRIARCLPPHPYALELGPREESPAARTYDVIPDGGDFDLHVCGRPALRLASWDVVLRRIAADAKLWVTAMSTSLTFVHAGVVGLSGGVLLLPGRSRAGKTTLVAELLRLGATYYSDDYAVIDREGHVWPFPQPLNVREATRRIFRPSRDFGAPMADGPGRVIGVVCTQFGRGVRFEPRPMTAGETLLAVLANAPPIRLRPRSTLAAARSCIRGAAGFTGHRGEASEAAAWFCHVFTTYQHPNRAWEAHHATQVPT